MKGNRGGAFLVASGLKVAQEETRFLYKVEKPDCLDQHADATKAEEKEG